MLELKTKIDYPGRCTPSGCALDAAMRCGAVASRHTFSLDHFGTLHMYLDILSTLAIVHAGRTRRGAGT